MKSLRKSPKARIVQPPRACEECGDLYVGHRRRKYCGARCAKNHDLRVRRKRPPELEGINNIVSLPEIVGGGEEAKEEAA